MMSSVGRIVVKDLVSRCGWLLAIFIVLQCAYALMSVGISYRYANAAVLPLMLLGMVPVLTPQRRLLQSLPIDRTTAGRISRLYGGGLVVIVATAADLLALLLAAVFSPQSIDSASTVTLFLGLPGAVGLYLMLRRWTLSSIQHDFQSRPILLANYFAFPILAIAQALIRMRNLGSAIAIVFLSAGLAMFFLFLMAPERYVTLTTKKPRVTDIRPAEKSSLQRAMGNPIVLSLVLWSPVIVLLAWLRVMTKSTANVELTLAVIAMLFGMICLPAIKTLRSLPRSIDQITAWIMALFIAPPLATLLLYAIACATLGHPANVGNILPCVALAAPLAPIYLRQRLRNKLRPLPVYVALTAMATLVSSQVADFAATHTVLVNVVALILIATIYPWLRHELRIGAMFYHYRSTANLWAA